MARKKNNQIIKICCVIAAFALWLYISTQDNSPTEQVVKNVKVQLINTDAIEQQKLIELPKEEYTVTLKISGLSSDVRAVVNKPEAFKVIADMSKYTLKKGKNNIPVQVQSNPSNVGVLKTTDMWVVVELDELAERTVPIKVDLKGKPKTGYYNLTPIVKPSDITITGAEKYVSKVASVIVKPNITGLDKDTNLSLPLTAIDSSGNPVEGIKLIKEFVEVSIPIKKVKSVGINIQTKGNLNKDIQLKALTAEPLKIDITGSEDVLNDITSLNTEPIDLSKIGTVYSLNSSIEVRLVIPNNVTQVTTNGGSIRVKIEAVKSIQRTISIDVKYKNLSELYTLKPEKTTISLVVSGEEAVLNNLKNEDFSAYIDFTTAVEGENIEVPIIIDNLPQGVTKVSASAEKVKVTIAKKIIKS